MTKSEQTKIDAMAFLSVSRLPKKLKEGDCYTEAIVKVQKYDGNQYYAIQKSDKEGNLNIVKDFEEIYAIHSIVDVYPIEPFVACINNMPLKVVDVEDKIKYLLGFSNDWIPSKSKLETMDVSEIDELCKRMCRALMCV